MFLVFEVRTNTLKSFLTLETLIMVIKKQLFEIAVTTLFKRLINASYSKDFFKLLLPACTF